MWEWVLIVFTAMPPHVAPAVSYVPVPSEVHCQETIDHVAPKFKAVEGLVYRFECRRVKILPKGEEESGTVNE